MTKSQGIRPGTGSGVAPSPETEERRGERGVRVNHRGSGHRKYGRFTDVEGLRSESGQERGFKVWYVWMSRVGSVVRMKGESFDEVGDRKGRGIRCCGRNQRVLDVGTLVRIEEKRNRKYRV